MRLKWMELVTVALALGGCQKVEPVIVDQAMKASIAPQAQAIWDVSNRGMDDNGYPDASKLSAADWDNLGKSAQAMKDTAARLAGASKLVAAPAGSKPTGGAATSEQIQAYIDADPEAFAENAKKLAAISDQLVAAAKGRDAAKLMDAAGGLDAVCENCHIKFWYPEPPTAGQ